jgi:hypothetical protein
MIDSFTPPTAGVQGDIEKVAVVARTDSSSSRSFPALDACKAE